MTSRRTSTLDPIGNYGKNANIQVLDDDWREKMVRFIRALGIPFRIRSEPWEQPEVPAHKRLVPGGTFWADGQLWLDVNPANGPLEWFYFIAQFGIARPEERDLFDFGVFDRTADDMLERENKARQLTVGWCIQSGMDPESLSQVMWDWSLTMITKPWCKMPGEIRWNMRQHWHQCSAIALECVRRVEEWGMPKAPVVWHIEYFSFTRNEVRRDDGE